VVNDFRSDFDGVMSHAVSGKSNAKNWLWLQTLSSRKMCLHPICKFNYSICALISWWCVSHCCLEGEVVLASVIGDKCEKIIMLGCFALPIIINSISNTCLLIIVSVTAVYIMVNDFWSVKSLLLHSQCTIERPVYSHT